MKKAFSALAPVLALCLALAGCHISTPDTVGTVGETEITSGLYLLAQFDAYQQAAQLAGTDQDYNDVKSFLKETITLDEETGETALVSDYVAEKTMETLRFYAAVEERFEELGGELTEAQTAQADAYAQQLLDNYGTIYAANGIGLESLKLYERNLVKSAALLDLVYGPEGETPVSDADLLAHLDEMLYTCYISVPLYDSSTFAFADEDQTAQMLTLAEEAAAGYTGSSAADFQAAVTDTVSEMYAVLGGEYTPTAADFATGFLLDSDLEISFTEEAANTVRGLEVGQAAAVEYRSYAILLLVRLDPLDTLTLDQLRGDILSDLCSETLQNDLTAQGEALADGLDAGVMAKLPAKKITMG